MATQATITRRMTIETMVTTKTIIKSSIDKIATMIKIWMITMPRTATHARALIPTTKHLPLSKGLKENKKRMTDQLIKPPQHRS